MTIHDHFTQVIQKLIVRITAINQEQMSLNECEPRHNAATAFNYIINSLIERVAATSFSSSSSSINVRWRRRHSPNEAENVLHTVVAVVITAIWNVENSTTLAAAPSIHGSAAQDSSRNSFIYSSSRQNATLISITLPSIALSAPVQAFNSTFFLFSPHTGSPSVIHEKKKMLDITRDKPIKIAVRVQVPVRDHPKFNFVGKLLGPKGNSLKRLQEETMCKMAVLGKGSMRDRKKEEELRLSGDPRYAHLSEDLHVEISTYTAPAEAHARIAYALAEVRRFLVPDYHDDIRQEQMWEMQALNSAQNASSGTNGNCNGTTTTLNGHGTNLGNGTTHGNVTLNGNGLNGGNPEMMHHQSCGVDSIGSNGTSSGGGSSSNGNSGNNGCGGVLSGSDGNSNHPSSQQQQHQHSTSHHHHPHHHHHQHQQQQFLSSSASVAAAAAAADAAVAAAATVTDMSNLMPVDVNMTSANHFVNCK
nr:KH domain-containing, RNA-binding, signal transduction-associated protein 2-like [Aedes albopictus]